MKRLLLFLSAILSYGMVWSAGIWTPSMANSQDETIVYVRVFINGTMTNTGLEVAAFIDDECRADATTAVTLGSGTTATSAYKLRVLGNPSDKEGNKTIKFKAFYNNLVYAFTTTTNFTGEYITPIPLDLYLDAVMGVTVTNPINIVATLPAERDLTSDVTITYDETTRTNKSTLETLLTYKWTPSTEATYITVNNTTNKLTATAETPTTGVTLGLKVEGVIYGNSTNKKQYTFNTSTQVIVKEPVIEVSSIELNKTSITAQVDENYLTRIAEEGVTVTVLPTNASDKTWKTSIDPSSTATVTTAGIITGDGILKVIFSSNSNPEATATLTITIPKPVSFQFPADLELSKLHSTAVNFINFAGDNFDKSLISIIFSEASNGQPCATAVMSDGTGLKWNFTGQYVGNSYTYQVKYNGKPMSSTSGGTAGIIRIPAEVPLNNVGWDWISLYAFQAGQTAYSLTNTSGNYLAWLNMDPVNNNNKIIDLRSQTGLLYNDATWGFIGDITELSPTGGMYKVKAKYDDASMCVLNLGADCVLITSTTATYNTIQTGYTWISYPLETATTISQTQLATQAQAGDKIIGKTTSAEFDGTDWLPGDFNLEPGKGYIYFTTGDGGFRPNFNPTAPGGSVKGFGVAPATELVPEAPSPWEYDASSFADNMPIVAALEGIEVGERFSIGAYVNGECRGEGRSVKDNIFIINVSGLSGERVYFRLYNKVTGEFSDLDQTVTYSSQQGSLRAPVKFSGSGVIDGIQNMEKLPQKTNDAYNLAGQKVGRNYHGIVITNGHKVMK